MNSVSHLFRYFLIPDLILARNKTAKNLQQLKSFTSLDTEGVTLEKAEIKWQCLTIVLTGGWSLELSLVPSLWWCNSEITGRDSFSAVMAASFTRALKSAPLLREWIKGTYKVHDITQQCIHLRETFTTFIFCNNVKFHIWCKTGFMLLTAMTDNNCVYKSFTKMLNTTLQFLLYMEYW